MITDSAEGGELETDYDDGCPIVPRPRGGSALRHLRAEVLAGRLSPDTMMRRPAAACPTGAALRLRGFPDARIVGASAFPTMATVNPAVAIPTIEGRAGAAPARP